MEDIEGWEPHPTRKNIYKNLKTGLLYRRRESGSFDRIPQKMTEHQELEDFRNLERRPFKLSLITLLKKIKQ